MAFFSATVIRSLGRSLIPTLLRRGFSARRYRRFLIREFGKSYRWGTVLADFREFRGMLRFENAVRALKPTTKPSRSIMTPAAYKRERRYRGIGEAVYQHRDTGEFKTKIISMYDEHFESKQAFTDTWMRDKGWEESDPEWQAISVDWFVIQHKEIPPF